MRLAAIADVHGNCAALEAVLSDIEGLGIADVVNLGDNLSGPLEADRAANLLSKRDFPSVRGNHDRWLIEQPKEKLNKSDDAADSQLTAAHRTWLSRLPETVVYKEEVFLCHGTPTSDTTYWLESVTPDGIVHQRSLDGVEKDAQGVDFPLILCGHTHLPRVVQLQDGRLIVNPGSVGAPGYNADEPVFHVMQAGTPDACYAVLEKVDNRWHTEFRYVPYDNVAMAEMAARAGRPEWASALSTGWVK